MPRSSSDPTSPRARRKARRRAARRRRIGAGVAGFQRRQARLERWLETRFPAVWDYRHAAQGVGRLVAPLVGAVLAALILAPLAALATLIWHLLGIHLPSVDLPDIPTPDVHVPGWLEAIGRVLGAVLDVFGEVFHWLLIAALIVFGVRRGRRTSRARREAESVGRAELQQRLVTALAGVEARAEARGVQRVGEAAVVKAGAAVQPQGRLAKLEAVALAAGQPGGARRRRRPAR